MKKSFFKHTGSTLDAVISLALYQYPQPQDLTSFSRRSKGKSSGFNLEKKKKMFARKAFCGEEISRPEKHLLPKLSNMELY